MVLVLIIVELLDLNHCCLQVIIWYWHKRSLFVGKMSAKAIRNAVLYFLDFDVASLTLAKLTFPNFLSLKYLFLSYQERFTNSMGCYPKGVNS